MTMVINGSGSITGLSAGGLPSATVTQATLATPVAGTGPAFIAYQSSAQGAITAATYTKVLFQTSEFDTNTNFATSRFTPTVAGYYQLNGTVRVDGSPTRIILSLYKNGASYKVGNDITSPVQNVVSSIVYANGSTDYYEIYVYASGGTPTLTATGTANIYFNGAMVRSA